MTPEPVISVIVPAHDAEATLGLTLAALDRQNLEAPFEVVVVDDASKDGSALLVDPRRHRLVRLERQVGPADARVAGIEAARAPLLAFTDADCEPCAGWLSALVTALADHDLVQGPVLPDPSVPRAPFDRTLRLEGASPRFETANLGVRRELAERAGGFEAFRPSADPARRGIRPCADQGHFGEDAVFGWRVMRLGARRAFVPEATVHHAVFPRGPRGYLAERWRLRYFPSLVRELPELRTDFPLGVFLSRRTAELHLGLAGLVTAALTRRRWPALAVVPYLRHRAWGPQELWRPRVLAINAVFVAGDVIGAVALIRGSVAARRPVL